MGTLEKIKESGLHSEFEQLCSTFFTEQATERVKEELFKTVDLNGLQSNEIMRVIGDFQRNKYLVGGLYGEFGKLDKKLSNDWDPVLDEGNGETETETETQEGGYTVDQTANQLSVQDQQKIEEFKKKEEEKFQKRMLVREAKLRDRLGNKVKAKAQRWGLTPDQVAEISEKNALIEKLRSEMRERRELINAARARIHEIRPVKKRGPRKPSAEAAQAQA